MITREQVEDLRLGDVVELRSSLWAAESRARGPVYRDRDAGLVCCNVVLYPLHGWKPFAEGSSLTLVARAVEYVNHDRAHMAAGDVARNADDNADTRVWYCAEPADTALQWFFASADEWTWSGHEEMPARLRLLVDGDSGQAVPS